MENFASISDGASDNHSCIVVVIIIIIAHLSLFRSFFFPLIYMYLTMYFSRYGLNDVSTVCM